MESEDLLWHGWKDITLEDDLRGATITKGSGYFEKNYTYIKIPSGYGYDNYCFLLSEKCVNESYFSICHDMNIELIIDPELREQGKKYKRYKLSGYELFETVYKEYEINFEKEYQERAKREKEAKEERDRKKIGNIICGRYTGNVYSNRDHKYVPENYLCVFFDSGAAYSNKKFDKVQNVKRKFIIAENVSKHFFNRWEEIMNSYVSEYEFYLNTRDEMKARISSGYEIETGTEGIGEKFIYYCEISMDDILKRLKERIGVYVVEKSDPINLFKTTEERVNMNSIEELERIDNYQYLSDREKQSIVNHFKTETLLMFNSFNGQKPQEIEQTVCEYVKSIINAERIEAQIIDIAITGSRCRGLEHEGSDLDVVIEYSGNIREDDFFNLLHSNEFKIENIPVDINPITKDKSGDMGLYLLRAEDYLEEVRKTKEIHTKGLAEEAAAKDSVEKSVSNNLQEPEFDSRLLPDKLQPADMQDYGYKWDGILPLTKERAAELFDSDVTIYKLHPDNTEIAVEDKRLDIEQYDGMFGIEKRDWLIYLRDKIELMSEADREGLINGVEAGFDNGYDLAAEDIAIYHCLTANVRLPEKLTEHSTGVEPVDKKGFGEPPKFSPVSKEDKAEMDAYRSHVEAEIAQEVAAAGMTVEEYAANGYEPREKSADESEHEYIMSPRERQRQEIATIKERNVVLNLSDADCDRLARKAGEAGISIGELLEGFIGDLVGGTHTHGSDEEYLAKQWFDRCGFRMHEESLLQNLINLEYDVDTFLDVCDNIKQCEEDIIKSKEHPEEYDPEEITYLEDDLECYRDEFNDFTEDFRSDHKAADMDKEIEICRKWRDDFASLKVPELQPEYKR